MKLLFFFSRLVRLLTCGVVWCGMLYIEIIVLGYVSLILTIYKRHKNLSNAYNL
jgi:hypothetical protein